MTLHPSPRPTSDDPPPVHSSTPSFSSGHDAPSWTYVAQLQADLLTYQELLVTTRMVEQAKGMLMAHFGVSAGAAGALLLRWAGQPPERLRGLAEEIVRAGSQPGDALAALLARVQAGSAAGERAQEPARK